MKTMSNHIINLNQHKEKHLKNKEERYIYLSRDNNKTFDCQEKKWDQEKQWNKILKLQKKIIAKLRFYVKKFPQKFRSEKDVIDK